MRVLDRVLVAAGVDLGECSIDRLAEFAQAAERVLDDAEERERCVVCEASCKVGAMCSRCQRGALAVRSVEIRDAFRRGAEEGRRRAADVARELLAELDDRTIAERKRGMDVSEEEAAAATADEILRVIEGRFVLEGPRRAPPQPLTRRRASEFQVLAFLALLGSFGVLVSPT